MNTKNIILAALVSFAACSTPSVHSMEQKFVDPGQELAKRFLAGDIEKLEEFFKSFENSNGGLDFDINQEITLMLEVNDEGLKPRSNSMMHFACLCGNVNLINKLIEYGASINLGSKSTGNTSLHYACMYDHEDAVKFLLRQRDIKVNARNLSGATPLCYACRRGTFGTIALLLAFGADKEAKTDKGNTLLHDACWRGYRDIAALLIVYKADVHAKNKDGKTPLKLALDKGHADVAALLLLNGAL